MRWGKVSVSGALTDYGVVITGTPDDWAIDERGTAAARALMAADSSSDEPFFDRGPGYARLSGGRTSAEVDRL